MRAKMSRSAALSKASGGDPHSSAFESKFQHSDFEHNAQVVGAYPPYIAQSAKHSWTFNLGTWPAGDGTGRGLLNLSRTAVVERAMLELGRVCYSALR